MKKVKSYTSGMYWKIICIYVTVLLIVGGYACQVSYMNRQNEMLNDLDDVMIEMHQEYKYYTRDFWRLYMPIFQEEDNIKDILKVFFTKSREEKFNPLEKMELLEVLPEITKLDNRIKWLGLYSGRDGHNYLYWVDSGGLVEMPLDFPFIEDMEQKGAMMEVYGSKKVQFGDMSILCFALCGGTGFEMNGGKILVGYATGEIDVKYKKSDVLRDVRYYVVNEWGIVYDSTDRYVYPEEIELLEEGLFEGRVRNKSHQWMYVRKLDNTGNSHEVYCIVPWKDLFWGSCKNSWQIFLMLVIFLACSLILYLWNRKHILRKISKIEFGLEKIGESELDYRIPVSEKQRDEFDNISMSINEVTTRLQENINKTYELKLKQKEAVLSELQAKFDPHFLYNTLEVIRGKVYENGDIETSDVIIKLVQIFRSFIGSDRFVTIREEVDFCNMYLSLLKYRYEERITIVYDIESEIFQYGIIRNLLQPVLENFFVHGFDAESKHNTLKIRGKIFDEEYIEFYVQDDGLGISEERLAELKETLDDAVTNVQSGYGLKNVQRRIKLFYGQDCGIEIYNNQLGGVTVEVKIRKLSYEEHRIRLYDSTELLMDS